MCGFVLFLNSISDSNLGQVVCMHVSLSSSRVQFGTGQGVVSALQLRRSGVALAMRHRLQWFIHLWAHGEREMSTPHGV